MKKIFYLACAAMMFAACSSETTEDVMYKSEIVTATVDTRSSNGPVCDKRGSDCLFLSSEECMQGQDVHYHCIDANCEYFNGYFLTEQDAWNHCKSNQGHHGGKGSFE